MKDVSMIGVTCNTCGERCAVMVPSKGYLSWALGGELIQNAMPDLPKEVRELLISKTCGLCWDKMFGGMEE